MKTIDLGKVSIVPRGNYTPENSYRALDIVTHDGSAYLVLKDCTGVTPATGEFYQLLSQRGPQGEKGEPGPKGDTGAKGASGSNATINGYNTINIVGRYGILTSMSGSTLEISQLQPYSIIAGIATLSNQDTYTISPGHSMIAALITLGYGRNMYIWANSQTNQSTVLKDLLGSNITCTVTKLEDGIKCVFNYKQSQVVSVDGVAFML